MFGLKTIDLVSKGDSIPKSRPTSHKYQPDHNSNQKREIKLHGVLQLLDNFLLGDVL